MTSTGTQPREALLQNVAEYLHYMQELGITGLALDENPFAWIAPGRVAIAAVPGQGPARAGIPEAAPIETRPTAKVAQPPATQPRVSLFAGLDEVLITPAEENRQKAEACTGADKEEALRNLYQAFHLCQACALGTTRTRFVFGEGPPDAELMFVGEGPGHEEDLSGRPFVGRAGQLLTKIIEAMGYRRQDVFIANVVKCRPPGNRTPLADEMEICSPILARQVELIDPKIIVVLGSTALRFFRGANASIMRMRGTFFDWRGRIVMPTFHPAYILRNPSSKRETWDDMKQVIAKVKELQAGASRPHGSE